MEARTTPLPLFSFVINFDEAQYHPYRQANLIRAQFNLDNVQINNNMQYTNERERMNKRNYEIMRTKNK